MYVTKKSTNTGLLVFVIYRKIVY